jgi:hypothetical protein
LPTSARLLELLAYSPNGASEALLLARGFSRAAIVDLLHAESVTITPERTLAAERPARTPAAHVRGLG